MLLPNVAIDFIYDNEKLSDYGMMLCEFDSNTKEVISVGSNLTFNTVKTHNMDKNYFVNYSYDEPYLPHFKYVKDCYGENKYITSEELTLYFDGYVEKMVS